MRPMWLVKPRQSLRQKNVASPDVTPLTGSTAAGTTVAHRLARARYVCGGSDLRSELTTHQTHEARTRAHIEVLALR